MRKLLIPLIIILIVPLAYALSFDVYVQSDIEQGVNSLASLTIISDERFDGSVDLTYSSNIESSTNSINFIEGDFTGSSPYEFTYIWYVKGTAPGTYDIDATLSNQSEEIAVLNKTGTVTDSTPYITSKSPNGILQHNTINIGVVTNENTVCKGTINSDESYDNMDFTFLGTQLQHNYSLSLEEGSYDVYVKCKDIYDNTMLTSEIITFEITLPIKIDIFLGSHAPSDVITESQITINVTTNEPAECKYDSDNVSYSSMDYLFYGTGTTHSATLSLNNGEYTYYIKCKNNVESNAEVIHFKVDLPPTAQITLNHDSPLKEGIIEVTLLSSEKLIEAPILEYTFNDAPNNYKPVSLSGSDSLWKGFMIIKEQDDNKVGTFYFKGKDSIGSIGTVITDGSIFTVDTSKPDGVISVKATSESNRVIKLSWHSEDNNVDYYKIYRSVGPGVSYVDYYKDENDTQFLDYWTENKVTYYYKVAAVDKAGNLGELSEEVYATALSSNGTEEEEDTSSKLPKVLPPASVIKVDETINKINNMLIDLDTAISTLEDKDSKTKEIVDELKLINEVNSAKTKLNNYKTELTDLKTQYMSESELDLKLNQIELDMKKIKKVTPKDTAIVEETVYLEAVTKEDIKQALEKLLENSAITDDQMGSLLKKNEEEKESIKIETTLKVVTVTYLDQITQEKTLIKRRISYEKPEPLQEVNIIEIIPKSVIENTADIEFITNNYEILQADPIIKWGFFELTYEGNNIKYRLDKKIDLNNFKLSKATPIVLVLENQNNEITGMATSIFTLGKVTSIFLWIGLVIISGLVVYYLFFIKTDDILKKIPIRRIKRKDKPRVSEPKNVKVHKIHSNTDLEFINTLITEAHLYIQNGQYNRAAVLYPKINLLYKYLSPQFKQAVYPKCEELHSKIQRYL